MVAFTLKEFKAGINFSQQGQFDPNQFDWPRRMRAKEARFLFHYIIYKITQDFHFTLLSTGLQEEDFS